MIGAGMNLILDVPVWSVVLSSAPVAGMKLSNIPMVFLLVEVVTDIIVKNVMPN